MPPDGTKAWLQAKDGKLQAEKIWFALNPTQYSIANMLTYKAKEVKGSNAVQQEFEKGERTLNLELFVDEYESGGNAADYVRRIEGLTTVDETLESGKKKRPPHVLFGWGKQQVFGEWVITSSNVTYTLFHEDGVPARAKIKLTLKEALSLKAGKGTNPTSGGMSGRSSHRVRPGETIDQIAFQELGDAALWPHLAAINDLDDPRHLQPGRYLVVANPE